jgi:CRISPR system Cascade subunit CasD
MTTLLLRLAGPMQAWGTQSRFTIRDTGREPSKSGVIGLLCAALGRPRSAPLDDLVALRMGVRVDREGVVQVDYHTAGGVHRRGERYGVAISDAKGRPRTVVAQRYYLADADFLVGLEGDDALLRELDRALAAPVWPLFLGRKAFVPGVPVRLPEDPPRGPGIRAEPLEVALRAYPWPEQRSESEAPPTRRLRMVLDATPDDSYDVRQDVPVSFDSENRQFRARYVRTDWLDQPEDSV